MSNRKTHIISTGQGVLLVGDIAPLEELEREANADDLDSVVSFTARSRRQERLAWRIMLRRWVGHDIEVEYTPAGAPQIKNLDYPHISVSHCHDKVAVVLSVRPCAVDIESLNRNFAHIASRFMSEEESKIATSPIEQAAVWSGKEALYKLCGIEGLDLRRDIAITTLDLSHRLMRGCIADGPEVEMQILDLDDHHIVVYYI